MVKFELFGALVKKAFSSGKIHLPHKPLSETRLPYPLASDVSVQAFNSFIESKDKFGYKIEYRNGTIYIVDMTTSEHEAVVEEVGNRFRVPNGGAPIRTSPLSILGQPAHQSPSGDGSYIMPDLVVYPNPLFVPPPPVPHPGPPPSDKRGNPHARIILEVTMAQRYSDLKEKCKLWMQQPYVRAVLGIKLHETKNTRNAQGHKDRAMKAVLWRQGAQKQKWQFGTINEDGSPNGCNAPNILNYLINIPVREVFYDPPVPAIAYTPLPTPPAVLMGTNITIDLYEVQQSVLLYQEK